MANTLADITAKVMPKSGGDIASLTVAGKNVVRTINGSTADANGNVTLELPTGEVSLKATHTITIKDGGSAVTKTITGLVANKPFYVVEKYSSGVLKCAIESGAISTFGGSQTLLNSSGSIFGLTSSTTLVLKFSEGSSSTSTSTFFVYQ